MINFLSWVSLIKYLRRVPGVRGYIPLLEASLKSLVYFFVVILLFMMAFGSSIRLLTQIKIQAHNHDSVVPDTDFSGESILDGIVN